MIKAYKILIATIALLALTHCILAFIIYPSFSKDFFWFFGTGLALIYCAIINHINLIAQTLKTSFWQNRINILTQITNLTTFIFGITIAIKFRHLPGTLVAVNTLLLLICGRVNKKTPH